MRNKRLTILVVACLALIFAALPVLSACSNEAGSEQSLKVGMSTPSSGAAAEKGAPMGHGNLDAVKYINDELGGIDGHPLEVIWLDNGYDASKMVTNVNAFMDQGALFFTTSSSTMMTAAMETANRAEFPGLVCFNAPILHRPPQHIYGQKSDYADDWLTFADYYMKNIWKGTGKPKMALHLLNNTTGYGARDGAQAGAEKFGIEIVAIEEHASTTISEMESLTRIKALDPDVLYIASTPKPAGVVIKNAVELGMYPGITIATGQAALTTALIDLAGADTVEGVYGVYPAASWGEDVPGMAKLVEYNQNLHPADANNPDYLTSWAQTLVVAEILRKTLENVDYEELVEGDVEAWRAIEQYGFQGLDGYDVEGLQAPVQYTAGDNRLSNLTKVYRIQGGQITPLTDWLKADLIKFEEYDWFGK